LPLSHAEGTRFRRPSWIVLMSPRAAAASLLLGTTPSGCRRAMAESAQGVSRCPYGTGANGKSTFINTIAKIFGDYATVADMSTFVATDRTIACAKGMRWTVLGLKPNLVAALRTDRPSLRASRIRSSSASDIGGRPSCLPSSLARARPARTRS